LINLHQADVSEAALPSEAMKCIECERAKQPDERGWVTVLSPSGELRIHYCPDCMEELVGRAAAVKKDDSAKS
jgi:predicted RNA-binding Zn-ribbon protein involved in translation (DUF1610 family)